MLNLMRTRFIPAIAWFAWAAVLLAGSAHAAAKKIQAEGDWPPITDEERALQKVALDPEADAVVLSHERHGKIVQRAEDWVNALSVHQRLKVLTEAGKRFAQVRIPAGKRSRVSNLQARTVKADGTVVPVASDQIFEKVVLEVGPFRLVEMVFSFPAVEPGAILEYRYDRHDDVLIYLRPWFFEGPEFTLRSRVTQTIPGGMGYSILCELCPPGTQPEITDWREGSLKGQRYSMELKNLPGYREEILMPPQREAGPRLEMSLQSRKNWAFEALGRQDRILTDWASVAQWAGFYYDRAIKEGQADLKRTVDGWVQGLSDPQERIRAVVRHVQDDFRYIPFDDVYGFSRPLGTILKERSADNEEKAVLLRGALQAIGVDSEIALVAGKHLGSLNPKFFSFSQFTHAVVALTRSDGTRQWIDPTVSHAPAAFMPWKDSGAGALLIKGKDGALVDLPARSELSATRYRVEVRPQAGGRALLDVEAQYLGEDAIEARQELRPSGEEGRRQYLQRWAEARRAGAVLKSHAFENLDDLDKPLKIRMEIDAPGLVTQGDEVLLVRGCVLSCLESNPISRDRRTHPFYVDRGWKVEETVVIRPPEGVSAPTLPPRADAKSALASLSFTCSPLGGGTVQCARTYAAPRGRWAAAEAKNLRSLMEKIVEADRSMVAFQRLAGGS